MDAGVPADAAPPKNIARLEQQYRFLAEQLVRRAETDEAFAQQVRLDPVKALVDAGVPADAADELLLGVPADVAARSRKCVDLTCWTSRCPGTCEVYAVPELELPLLGRSSSGHTQGGP